MKIARIGLTYVLPLGSALLPIGILPPYGSIIGGAVGSALGGWGYASLQVDHQWPNHN